MPVQISDTCCTSIFKKGSDFCFLLHAIWLNFQKFTVSSFSGGPSLWRESRLGWRRRCCRRRKWWANCDEAECGSGGRIYGSFLQGLERDCPLCHRIFHSGPSARKSWFLILTDGGSNKTFFYRKFFFYQNVFLWKRFFRETILLSNWWL